MKLLYLYVRDYRILKDVEFNFDSTHRFHFDKDTKILSKEPSRNPLPDDFFSIDKSGKDTVVESISALIGDNGAGKTSVANLIHALSFDHTIEHIIGNL